MLNDIAALCEELEQELIGQEDDGEYALPKHGVQCIDYYRKYLQGAIVVSGDKKPWVVSNISHGYFEEENIHRLFIYVRKHAPSKAHRGGT